MRLDDYLRLHGLSAQQFAAKADVASRQTVYNWRHGLRFPGPTMLVRIERATDGLVTAADFLTHHTEKAKTEDAA